ncbi:hypothetical protein IT407_03355 [Candidatus Uhrbacteria bacterium]|nr:hypothetical protein [Candidatus Uhrbacteria bacterium]
MRLNLCSPACYNQAMHGPDCKKLRSNLELTRQHFDSFKKFYQEFHRTGGVEAGELMVFFKEQTEYFASKVYEGLETDEKIALKLRDAIAKKHSASYVSEFVENRARMELAGAWCFVDRSGEIISGGYPKLRNYSNGRAWAFINNDVAQLLDESGESINSTFRYKTLHDFHDGYAIADTGDGEIHILDKNGEIHSKISGSSPTEFKYNRSIIRNSQREYVFINAQGEELYGTSYEVARELGNGVAFVARDRKIELIDAHGKKIAGPFSVFNGLNDGVSWAKRDGETNWILVNEKGEVLREEPFAEMDKIRSFSDGIGITYKVNTHIFIDTNGNRVNDPQSFQKLYDYSERIVLTNQTSRGGKKFVNMKGKTFDLDDGWEPRKFHNGMCAIKRGESDWIFLNRDLVVMKGSPFQSIRDFDKWGVGKIKTDDKWHYVDREGNILFENPTP